ncbi:MAG: mechanosensitive ion channel [Flavobacteriales bacterium]|nr:mechanosensitive ion channel [Flavobacteriales bacterium]
MSTEEILNQVNEIVFEYGPKLVGAILVWIIGGIVIKLLVKGVDKVLDKRKIEITLKPFLRGIVGALLKVMLVISVLGMLGIEMTSFVAILGAAGLAVGLALSGTLQNFAGEVMILIFKPFKSGDYLEAQGHIGIVSEVQIFNTILKTLDNKTIIIPNGGLSNSSMVNYSTEPARRVDWTFGIAYGDDTAKAKEVMINLMAADSRILQDPAPFVAVSELGDSSVNFTARAWIKQEDYWGVFFDMNEKVYNTFNKEGLNIPYPQMDVHIHKSE